jgi:hypothetical protein
MPKGIGYAKTVVSPNEEITHGVNKKLTQMTQSAAPPARQAPQKADARTFKPGPEIQTFRFKKNSRGHGGERE